MRLIYEIYNIAYYNILKTAFKKKNEENISCYNIMYSFKFRDEKSKNGFHVSLLKSALQKYIRRGETEKALTVTNELLDFHNVYFTSSEKNIKSTCKKIITNLINRIICIISEDIGIAEPNLPSFIYEKYLKILELKENKDKIGEFFKIILNIVEIMTYCKKIRKISDLRTVYLLPPYYLKNKTMLHEIHTKFMKDNKLDKYILNFEKPIKDIKITNDENQFFRDLSNLLYFNENANLTNFITKSDRNINALIYFYHKMKHQEKNIYLYHAYLMIIHDIQPDPLNYDLKFDYSKLNELKIIDDYCHDIHTGNKDKTSYDFAKEGAIVFNEDIQWLNDEHRHIYIEFKKSL